MIDFWNFDAKGSESRAVMFGSLQPQGLYSPWNSPGKNTRMGCQALLQEIFPTQGLNPGLPHCRQILCHLSHQGCPRILEWIAYPFSREPSWPRNWTGVSCIAGRFFTSWATREAHSICQCFLFPSKCRRKHCQPLKTCLLRISPASFPPELLLKIHALATLYTWGSLNGNAIFCNPSLPWGSVSSGSIPCRLAPGLRCPSCPFHGSLGTL